MVPHKKLLSSHENGFATDIEGIVAMLTEQFRDPTLCFRELVQNSLDENATKIDLRFDYDENNQILAISFSDNGEGMSYKKLERYLTIFDSTKEDLKDKIGKFGIGKLSAFALKPDAIVIETCDGGDGYKCVMDKNLRGKIMKINPVRGTNVTILKNMNKSDAVSLEIRVISSLKDSCEYSFVPIIINSEIKIGGGIDVDSEYKMPFAFRTKSGYNVRGVNAITGKYESSFLTLKGCLKLGPVEYPFSSSNRTWKIFGLETIVASSGFNHSLSRNKVSPDGIFREKTDEILENPLREFAMFCYSNLKKSWNEDIRSFLLGYMSVLSSENKKWEILPKELLNAKLFRTIDGKKISFKKVEESYKKEKFVYITNTDDMDKLRYFKKKGIPLIDELFSPYSCLRILENRLGNLIFIDEDTTLMEYEHKTNSKEEKNYLSLLRKGLLSECNFDRIDEVKDTAETEHGKKKCHYYAHFFEKKINLNEIKHIRFAKFHTIDGRPADWKTMNIANNELILNSYSNYIQSMIALSSIDPPLSKFYTMCEIIRNKNIFPKIKPESAEDFILDNMKGYLK